MWRSFFLVTLVWGAIYLPRLGSLELKSEEGRRVLPAVTMSQTGNYIVPQVGSEPYLRKPPLVNWLVAGSFKIFGARNEWTARLPSVLCVLAVALAFVGIARRSLGPNGSLAAAMIWLTNFGLLEKGRMIEIEALYVSLTALAFICWLSWWKEPGRRWLAWTVPWIFLGLALLAKGPLALFFFYAVVLAVLWQAQELRELWRWPHLVGLILMLAIFGAWAFPYLQMTEAGHVAGVWSKQFSGRVTGDRLQVRRLAAQHPARDRLSASVGGPATLCPLCASGERKGAKTLPRLVVRRGRAICRRQSDAGRFAALHHAAARAGHLATRHLHPVARSRFGPNSCARRSPGVSRITAAMLIYSLAIIPLLQRREKIRPIAAQLDAAIPPNELLYAIDPDYQPFLFYLQRPIVYMDEVSDLPRSAHYLLVQPADENAATHSARAGTGGADPAD